MFKTIFTIFRGSVAVAGQEPDGSSDPRPADARCGRSHRPLQAVAGDQAEGRNAPIADVEVRARALFASEVTWLKRHVANAEARITELDRGRLARLKAKRTPPA